MAHVKSRRTYAKKRAALLPALLAAFALACGSLVNCGGDDDPAPNIIPGSNGTDSNGTDSGKGDNPPPEVAPGDGESPPNGVPDFTGTDITGKSLADALAQIKNDSATTGNYRVTLSVDEESGSNVLSYTDRQVSIILRGNVKERTVTLNAYGALFTVNEKVTLTLEDITLKGQTDNSALIYVDGGTLVMQNDSAISGNASASYIKGGGVYVGGNGTFNMSGGAVSGNTSKTGGGGVYVAGSGTFTMTGGAVSGNKASSGNGGGGVYVAAYGAFNMSGGNISGNTAAVRGGGVYVEYGGTFNKAATGGVISSNNKAYGNYYGHAAYSKTGLSQNWYVDTAVNASTKLSSASIYGWKQVND